MLSDALRSQQPRLLPAALVQMVPQPATGLMCPQVKKLSVVRILQPITRNALKEPVPQGLYDTAMGPVDKTST